MTRVKSYWIWCYCQSKYQISTIMLIVAIKYSMHGLICDVSNSVYIWCQRPILVSVCLSKLWNPLISNILEKFITKLIFSLLFRFFNQAFINYSYFTNIVASNKSRGQNVSSYRVYMTRVKSYWIWCFCQSKYQISTIMLIVAIKYSMHGLICDVSNSVYIWCQRSILISVCLSKLWNPLISHILEKIHYKTHFSLLFQVFRSSFYQL